MYRLQTDQPEGQGVVGVGCSDAVAIIDELALALGVVVDVGDRVQVRGGRIEPAGRLGILIEPDMHLLQQVGLVVDRLGDIYFSVGRVGVRCNRLDGAVERVVAGAGGVCVGFQLNGAGP